MINPLVLIWGIGYSKNNVNATNPQNWLGLNLLGFALMEVWDALKRAYQNYEKIDWAQFGANEYAEILQYARGAL